MVLGHFEEVLGVFELAGLFHLTAVDELDGPLRPGTWRYSLFGVDLDVSTFDGGRSGV